MQLTRRNLFAAAGAWPALSAVCNAADPSAGTGASRPDPLGLVIHSFAVRTAGARALRERAEAASMYLEGIIALPRNEADVDRFEAEVKTARWAGASVVRT